MGNDEQTSTSSTTSLADVLQCILPSTIADRDGIVPVSLPNECPWPSSLREQRCTECAATGGRFAVVHQRRRERVHYDGVACLQVIRQTQADTLGRGLLNSAGLELAERKHTFASATVDDYNREVLARLATWTPTSGVSYYLTRPPEGHPHYRDDNPNGNGTGKSFLLHALAVKWCLAGIACRFVVAPDILTEIRATFTRDDEGHTTDSEASVLRAFQTVPVLLLDDFGMEAIRSDWGSEKFYQVINARTRAELPTIISTNLLLSELEFQFAERHGRAIVSRLAGTCRQLVLGGPDRRRQSGTKPVRSWADRYGE